MVYFPSLFSNPKHFFFMSVYFNLKFKEPEIYFFFFRIIAFNFIPECIFASKYAHMLLRLLNSIVEGELINAR